MLSTLIFLVNSENYEDEEKKSIYTRNIAF